MRMFNQGGILPEVDRKRGRGDIFAYTVSASLLTRFKRDAYADSHADTLGVSALRTFYSSKR